MNTSTAAARILLVTIERLARQIPAADTWLDENAVAETAGDFMRALAECNAARQTPENPIVREILEHGHTLLAALVRWADPQRLPSGAIELPDLQAIIRQRLRSHRGERIDLVDDNGDLLRWRTWPQQFRRQLDAAGGPVETLQPTAGPAGKPQDAAAGGGDDVYRELAKWAAKKLKRNQRRAVELLAENSGSLPIADIGSDAAIGWQAPYDDAVSSLIRELNAEHKLPSVGWRVHRHDNEIRLERFDGKMT